MGKKKESTGMTGFVSTEQGRALLEQVKVIVEKAEGVAPEVTAANLDRACELLARIRASSKEIEAQYEVMVADIKKALMPFDSDKRSWLRRVGAVDVALAEAILKLYQSDATIAKQMEGTLGSLVSVVEKQVNEYVLAPEAVVVSNITGGTRIDLPAKYLKPAHECVDWDAVQKDMAKGIVVKFVTIKPTKVLHLRTKAKEIVS